MLFCYIVTEPAENFNQQWPLTEEAIVCGMWTLFSLKTLIKTGYDTGSGKKKNYINILLLSKLSSGCERRLNPAGIT